jgi:MoxR-like ATPase
MNESVQIVNNIAQNVKKAIIGKDEQIRLALCCWLSGGHVLIEDNPGTGKTMLARAIAKSCGTQFKRVQFTPDLLPSDIIGSYILNQKENQFQFLPGPLFTTVFLGDEINRATPRTQSALLESMGEGQVTVEGRSSALNPLFFVIATQNPIEQHGTFPLPEAQLDRFMMKISMGYAKPEEEIRIVQERRHGDPIQALGPVETEEHIRSAREAVSRVNVTDKIYAYAMAVVSATRRHPDILLGASPRATLALIRGAQALALMEGLDFVAPSHVFGLLKPILAHRIMPTPEARLAGKSAGAVLDDVIKGSKVPVE